MTTSPIRLAVATNAMIFTLLSISMPIETSAISYTKCFTGWAYGYDKFKNVAGHKAILAWDTKAKQVLASPSATWAKASNRQRSLKKVISRGQKLMKAGVYGRLCKNNTPPSSHAPGTARGARLPLARTR